MRAEHGGELDFIGSNTVDDESSTAPCKATCAGTLAERPNPRHRAVQAIAANLRRPDELGGLFYFLLTGSAPFDGNDTALIAHAV